MKDARWLGVGLVVFVGALDGCGVDHIVGSGQSGSGTTATGGGAGFNGIGGSAALAGTGGDGRGGSGLMAGGTGGSSGRGGGTSGAGGATMAGTGGNGGVSAGSAGAPGGSGGDTGGIVGSGGASVGGSAGSTTNGEGGANGGEGGAGPEPFQCPQTTVRGTISDASGSTSVTGYQGTATLTSIVDHQETVPTSLEFVLRKADDSEWHYNVTLPCFPRGLPAGATPPLGIQAGDTVDIEDAVGVVGGTDFFSHHQAITMSHEGRLVIFTVDVPELDVPKPPDLSAFGFEIGIEPTTSGIPSGCGFGAPSNDVFERLVVTHGSETVRVEASQTALVGGFTFSVDELTHALNEGGGACDPWGWSHYGGFLMQP